MVPLPGNFCLFLNIKMIILLVVLLRSYLLFIQILYAFQEAFMSTHQHLRRLEGPNSPPGTSLRRYLLSSILQTSMIILLPKHSNKLDEESAATIRDQATAASEKPKQWGLLAPAEPLLCAEHSRKLNHSHLHQLM